MKSRIITLLTILSLGLNSYAGVIEHADNAHNTKYEAKDSSIRAINKWMDVAEKEVNHWWQKITTTIAEKTSGTKPTKVISAVHVPADNRSPAQQSPGQQVVATTSAPVPPVIMSVEKSESTEEQIEHNEIMKRTEEELNSKPVISKSSPGRKGEANFPLAKSGVVKFPLYTLEKSKSKKGGEKVKKIKVSSIPKLDIGEEERIVSAELTGTQQKVKMTSRAQIKAQVSPPVLAQKSFLKEISIKVPVVLPAVPPKSKDVELGQMVSQKKIEDVPLLIKENIVLKEMLPVKTVSPDDLKMISAVMTYEKGDKCHVAIGMFHDLARKPKYKDEANYYLGICAHQVGFNTEAVARLKELIKSENPEYTSDALKALVDNLPIEYNNEVAELLLNIKNKQLVPASISENWNAILARYYYEKKNYDSAIASAMKVSAKSAHYTKVQYIKAVSEYANKEMKSAEATLVKLKEWVDKNNYNDKTMRALIAVNLGRVYFNMNRYQLAHQEYLKIPKDHPLWVDALIEQGWAQLNIDDAAGAIGNMYSLHSPYFKSIFMPESWVVRTLGYIDICQYGDAYRTLTKLETMSKDHLKQIDKYKTMNKLPSDYYQTVKSYLIGRSDKDVNGLSAQIIREIARQKGFLNAQTAINMLEDEKSQFAFIYGLMNKDIVQINTGRTQAKARLAKVKLDLKKAKTNKELLKFVNEWLSTEKNEVALIKAYEYQLLLYKQAKADFANLQSSAVANIEVAKSSYKKEAGKELMGHLKDIQARIEQMLEGNEFLRYEIFSGSGENIRYQVAGGTTQEGGRIPSHIKPEKILNWEFDGEYWEDEIGSYRSTLKNNCPNSKRSVGSTINESQKTAGNFQ
jgi:hypothetical protein